jgi:hypothetical protein
MMDQEDNQAKQTHHVQPKVEFTVGAGASPDTKRSSFSSFSNDATNPFLAHYQKKMPKQEMMTQFAIGNENDTRIGIGQQHALQGGTSSRPSADAPQSQLLSSCSSGNQHDKINSGVFLSFALASAKQKQDARQTKNRYVSVWGQSSDKPCSCFEGLGSMF